ncbi:MAG TPA: hypothetical protein VES20_14460 [Bryobacteraceae bacterium]|nr:hypothetical protein [Bryobacteraceae bacterium]
MSCCGLHNGKTGVPYYPRHLTFVTTEEMIGWGSSLILLLTVGKQVYKQWESGSTEGISRWLFAGQTAASLGFAVYSWMVDNMVFVVTNSFMVANALLGQVILIRNRRRGS